MSEWPIWELRLHRLCGCKRIRRESPVAAAPVARIHEGIGIRRLRKHPTDTQRVERGPALVEGLARADRPRRTRIVGRELGQRTRSGAVEVVLRR
jgi:hypothetical protein